MRSKIPLNNALLYNSYFYSAASKDGAYPFLDLGLNEKIFTDTAGSAMMDTPGKN